MSMATSVPANHGISMNCGSFKLAAWIRLDGMLRQYCQITGNNMAVGPSYQYDA